MKHYAVRTTTRLGQSTIYTALCGYESEDPKEFVQPPQQPDPAKVTCEACRDYERNKSVAEWTSAWRPE